jgi:hypothetical protein
MFMVDFYSGKMAGDQTAHAKMAGKRSVAYQHRRQLTTSLTASQNIPKIPKYNWRPWTLYLELECRI